MTTAGSPAGGRSHYRFDGWEVLAHERTLRVNGQTARLGGRAFDLLLALVQRQGRVVGKAELLDAAWPGLVVEENNLSVQIAALRKLLGPAAIVNVSGHGYRLASQALPDGGPRGGDAEAGAPPGLPPLFGRDADVQAMLALLDKAAVLTLVGTGGVGKTALARVLTARSRGRWRDGEHWIDLAPLNDGEALAPLLAKSLGVQDFGSPGDSWLSVRPIQALIVLDNCEHLLDRVAALVGRALRVAPGLRWLATSQEPLRLPGEHVYRLEPLEVSSSGADPAAALACAAVALLCERVRAADHHFDLPPQHIELAADLCRQLDGLPLAIEMAAARVATLGLVDVHRQIGQRLQLRAGRRDVPPRQHTLRQTFEWSYGLLSVAEQRMFRRLEPFTGGFDTALALCLCCSFPGDAEPLIEWQAMDTLASLVDKSLVQRGGDGQRQRFHLLENARAFARLQLQNTGELSAVRERHAQAMADWSATALTAYDQLGDDEWGARFLPDRHNVREALGWAIGARQPDLLAQLLAALSLLDDDFAQLPSAVHCDVPLDLLYAAAPALRAKACLAFGTAHFLDGDRELGTELELRALADFEALDDSSGIHAALGRLVRLYEGRPGMAEQAAAAWARLQQIDDTGAPLRWRLDCAATVGIQLNGRTVERLQELRATALRAGFAQLARGCQINVIDQLLVQGQFDEAARLAHEVLLAGGSRPRATALTNHNLALALVQLGRIDEARTAARSVLRALPSRAYMIVDLFALDAARCGRWADAALMAGYGAEIKRQRDKRAERAEAAVIDETIGLLRAALDNERLAELLHHGALMQLADVMALALPD